MMIKKLLSMWALGALALVGAWLGMLLFNWLMLLISLVARAVGSDAPDWLVITVFVVAGPILAYASLQTCFPGARAMRAPWRRAVGAFRDADVAYETVDALRQRGIRAQLAGRGDLDGAPGGLEVTVPRRDLSVSRDLLRERKAARLGHALS